MSILNRLSRLMPWEVGRAVEAVPQLRRRVGENQKAVTRQLRQLTSQIEELQRMLTHQQEALAKLPRIHEQVLQCMTSSMLDADQLEETTALRRQLDPNALRSHAAAAVRRASYCTDPCPHLLIENLLPDEWCDELVRAIPPRQFFKSHNMARQEIAVPFGFAPAYNRLVWNVFFRSVIEGALIPGILERFGPELDAFVQRHWPSFGSLAGAGIDLQVTNSRLMLRRAGYEIKPHRDPRWALLTCLVYLQRRDDVQTYGTQFYRLKQERETPHSSPLWATYEECELVKDIPARRNTAVIFLNSTGVHGATVPADAPATLERYLYQAQFGPDQTTREKLIAALPDERRSMWSVARDASEY